MENLAVGLRCLDWEKCLVHSQYEEHLVEVLLSYPRVSAGDESMDKVCILQLRDQVISVSFFLLELEICVVEVCTVKLPDTNGGNIRDFVCVEGQTPIQRPCQCKSVAISMWITAWVGAQQ